MAKRSSRKKTDAPNTLRRLARKLFPDEVAAEQFLQAVWNPVPYTPAVLWMQPRPAELPFDCETRIDWQPEFVDRVDISHRPGQHALHTQGKYYCLGFSSVFTASVLQALPTAPSTVIDLCAAPGGKSMFVSKAFAPQTLVCNEVIGKRLGPLIGNLQRCQVKALVTSCDSSRLAEMAAGAADLVVVDAPCSGQSLIAQGRPSPGCFHPATINMNANRQRRILANAVQLVAPGGYLAYITCTYAERENERNARWLCKRFPELRAIAVPHLTSYQSHLSELPCYRLWPGSQEQECHLGAGGFCLLLQRQADNTTPARSTLADSVRDIVKWPRTS